MKYNYPGDVTIIAPAVQELIDALLGGLDEQALKSLLQMDPKESEHGIIHQWIRLEEYNPGVFRQDVKFW